MSDASKPPGRPSAAGRALRLPTPDGRWLHAEFRGRADREQDPAGIGNDPSAGPVVIFESGMGASRNMWGAVVDGLHAETRAERPGPDRRTSRGGDGLCSIVYDRSGLGRSPAARGDRSLHALAADLTAVIDHATGLDRRAAQVVLVGHSWGGPIARVAAAERPERIAGLVLVDPTDEQCDLFFGAAADRQTRTAVRVLPLAARLGLTRLAASRLAGNLPPRWADAMRAEDGTRTAIAAQIAELSGHVADLCTLRSSPPTLPSAPITVISGGRNGFGERSRRPALIEAHRRSAAACAHGRHVVAPASSHYVPFTEPDLVVEEIRRILD